MSTAPNSMRRRQWWLFAWLFGLYLVLLTVGFSQVGINPPSPQALPNQVSLMILFGAFAATGSLLVAHRPENPVGWIFYTSGMAGAFSGFGGEYARVALITNRGSMPFGYIFGLLSNAAWVWALVQMFTLLPLLFPTGRPPSPRWRWVGWLTIIGFLVVLVSTSLTPTIALGQEEWRYIVENPIGISGTESVLTNISSVAFILVLVSAFLSAVSLLFRYHRAAGQERAQIRWFAYAVIINVGFLFVSEITNLSEIIGHEIHNLLLVLILMTLPVTTAIATFKYRLFDIDIIIRRTLIYGALSLTLAAVFFGSVILLQNLFIAVSGQQSAVVNVISTLIIAALFTPLRRRIQRDIDRRFYRKKYDADKIVAEFGAGLRQEVNLEDLQAQILSVVEETLQPESASIWLRPVRKPEKL